MRGSRSDYDSWAAGGAEGWSYDEVLPYFRRAEDNERGTDEYHGVGGPLAVSDGRFAGTHWAKRSSRLRRKRATGTTPTSTARASWASAATR
ncbi:hypothetical protein GCM10017788_64900 [Amycolatopsis acidiphila]|nr:hypothetical protein GCM10017788_64900 [Amycolatopsis acidiphila]